MPRATGDWPSSYGKDSPRLSSAALNSGCATGNRGCWPCKWPSNSLLRAIFQRPARTIERPAGKRPLLCGAICGLRCSGGRTFALSGEAISGDRAAVLQSALQRFPFIVGSAPADPGFAALIKGQLHFLLGQYQQALPPLLQALEAPQIQREYIFVLFPGSGGDLDPQRPLGGRSPPRAPVRRRRAAYSLFHSPSGNAGRGPRQKRGPKYTTVIQWTLGMGDLRCFDSAALRSA